MIIKDNIDELVKKHLKIIPDSVESIYQGGMNYVYAIHTHKEKIMLKVYPPSRSYIAKCEYKILLAAHKNDVKVPRVIMSGLHKDLGFLMYHHIPGNDLRFEQLSTDQKAGLSIAVIENLYKFSQLSYPHFGSVTEVDPTYNNWNSFLDETIKVGLENLQAAEVVNPKKFIKIAKFLKQFERNHSYTGMALGDLKSENIIINNGQFKAMIDLESCFYGDPLISLGYLYAREGESPFYNSIAKSFETFIPFEVEDIYFYSLIRLLRISQHLKTPLPTGKSRDPLTNYFRGISNVINDIL